MIEKNEKTSTNQSTKFHQLQALFGHQGATIKDIANIQNSLMTTPKSGTPNGSLENIHLSDTEVIMRKKKMSERKILFILFRLQLRKAFNRQIEEIKNLKNQLANSEKRVQELQCEVNRLLEIS